MNILTYNDGAGVIKNQNGIEPITRKPVIAGLTFDSIYYEPETNNAFIVLDGENVQLTDGETVAVEAFIVNYVTVNKHYVNDIGAYMGYGDIDATEVPSAPPEDGNYYWLVGSWVWVTAADSNGNYLGNVPLIVGLTIVSTPPDLINYIWDFAGNWVDQRSLSGYVVEAKSSIDNKAGEVRLRYITDVAGQAATYNEKLIEAEAWAAATDPLVEDYPYINAESIATGVTPDVAAATIIATAEAWKAKGAQIEGARMKGKTDVNTATTLDEAKQGHNSSIANLEGM